LKPSKLNKIRKNWYNPLFYRNQLVFRLSSIVFRKNKGIYILNEEWDNLIILDACRYDIFKQEIKNSGINGTLRKVKSRGSHTTTFLPENFKKQHYPNIVYVTANPYVDKILKGKFHKIISVWKDGWSEKYHTVLPKTMYEYSNDAILKYPDKRLIIHFMQPHFPYIGFPHGAESMNRLRNSLLYKEEQARKRPTNVKMFSLYGVDYYRLIKRKDQIDLYRENLTITFPYLKRLVNSLPGKTVITADHGESIGDIIHPLLPIRYYGHNQALKTRVLINVPWYIINPSDKNPLDMKDISEKEKILKNIEEIKF